MFVGLGCSVSFFELAVSGPSFTLLILCHLPSAASDAQTQESHRVSGLSSESAAASQLALELYGEVRNIQGKRRGNLWLAKGSRLLLVLH